MTVLYFDCFSGAAGDMILGALLDAGVSLDDLQRALGSLAIDRDAIWTERVTRAGVSATKLHVRGEEAAADYAHDHGRESHQLHRHASDRSHRRSSGESHRRSSGESHRPSSGGSHRHASGELHRRSPAASHRRSPVELHRPPSAGSPSGHSHRTLAEIHRLIDGSALSTRAKDRAKSLFGRLAEAEAAVHGSSVEEVYLHEVGALDSIIDIAGTVYALETLGVMQIVASPLNVGSGTIRSAHGIYPVPGPATARLLQGAPIYSGPQGAELVTPTGALLITAYADSYGTIPAMRLQRVGYGAGSRDFPDSPNVLRVLIGDADSTAPSTRVVVIEAEIDDMNPQIFGVLIEQLIAAGALDVYYTSIQMKKNRPGTLLSIIAPPDARERLISIVFRETTTIGVRYVAMERECLDRETIAVQTPFGTVGVKVARRNGEVLNVSPEFDDCARLAAQTGKPVKEVQAAAMKAFLDR